MTDPEIIALFQKAAWEVDHKKLDQLRIEEKLSALGIGSIAMAEMIGYFEEQLGIHLPDDKLGGVQTLADLAVLINQARA